jgi:thioredoxin reductase/SAM-dependent methyltransferase
MLASMTDSYDVLIVGGGAAGLSAGVLLGRSRRSVLVLDAGEPRNGPAAGVHGFLSRDGIPPHELLALGRDEVRSYGGEVLTARATSAERDGEAFRVSVEDGRVFTGRRLLIATGLEDELPDIPGLRERWGRDVVHCPYCHGWELRDRKIGVLASGPIELAVHHALLFRQLSADVILFTHTAQALNDVQAERLAASNVRVVHGPVASLEVEHDQLRGAYLLDGTRVPIQAMALMPRMVARGAVLAGLGIQPTPHPLGIGEFIAADATGLTSVKGVWVAGNVTDLMSGIVAQAASGILAASVINADLVAEDTERAVAAHRDLRAALVTQEFWDQRYRTAAHHFWSGNPNPQLVAQVAELTPGEALDVGCGEGADAIWLAGRGWRVTAIDISEVALERGAANAAAAGAGIAERIRWQRVDLLEWEPGARQFDLVSAQFIHIPRAERAIFHRKLASAVRPGGSLLVVGHHPSDLLTSIGRPNLPDLMFTADEVASALDAREWEMVIADAPSREAADHEGEMVTIRDCRGARQTPRRDYSTYVVILMRTLSS